MIARISKEFKGSENQIVVGAWSSGCWFCKYNFNTLECKRYQLSKESILIKEWSNDPITNLLVSKYFKKPKKFPVDSTRHGGNGQLTSESGKAKGQTWKRKKKLCSEWKERQEFLILRDLLEDKHLKASSALLHCSAAAATGNPKSFHAFIPRAPFERGNGISLEGRGAEQCHAQAELPEEFVSHFPWRGPDVQLEIKHKISTKADNWNQIQGLPFLNSANPPKYDKILPYRATKMGTAGWWSSPVP